jgi:spore coat protein H
VDPALLREILSRELLFLLGIPVPRISFGNVFINQQNYGSYLIIEEVDKQFAKSRFGDDGDKFPLYKCCEGLRLGCEF